MRWTLSGAAAAALFVATASSEQQIPLPWDDGHAPEANARPGGDSNKKPNIVFVLTDDQDLHMQSLDYMPNVQRQLIEKGTLFERHYATIALCCPSRVSLWTGRAAHNTNVTDVNPPYGGYPKFVSQGFNEAWLPLWLQDAGYNTYYTGKLFNSHTLANYDSPFPSGFNGSDFLLDPYTYSYLNATFQRNRDRPVSHEGEYSTDVLAAKAYDFLDQGIADADTRPFFVGIAPIAPHSNIDFTEEQFSSSDDDDSVYESVVKSLKTSPPVPAARHAHLFPDVVVPRTPNFNPDAPSGVSWISRLPRQSEANVEANDHFYRNRLRALQAVDELVEGVIERLSAAGPDVLDNTYIFYSSDNGFHIGQHRLQPGKECGFEEDINVPLIVRGPGIAAGAVSHAVTTHTDLAPTFLSLAGAALRDDFDGSAIELRRHTGVSTAKRGGEHVNVEFWGFALFEGEYDAGMVLNNTYKALRLVGDDYDLYYSVWCSGEHQLYDLRTDPYELRNLYPAADAAAARSEELLFHFAAAPSSPPSRPRRRRHVPLAQLINRLDSLLLVLKSCRASSCTHPWRVLHPAEHDEAPPPVHDLHDALAAEFDDFYANQQPRVAFSRCEPGYILDAEGPIDVVPFGGGGGAGHMAGLLGPRPRGGRNWAELV